MAWFTVAKDFLVKVKFSKYLSTDGELCANKWSNTKSPTSFYEVAEDQTGRGHHLVNIRKLQTLWDCGILSVLSLISGKELEINKRITLYIIYCFVTCSYA